MKGGKMAGYIFTLVMLLLLFVCSLFLDEPGRALLLKENGIIETASVFGYFLCAVLIVYKGKLNYLKKYYYVFIVIVCFMLRELDFHKRFTTMAMFKIRLYTSNTVPLTEKIIVGIITLLLIFVVLTMIIRHARDFIYGLKNKSTISYGIFIAGVLLGISFTLDGLGRKLKDFGVGISSQTSMYAGTMEEVLELGIPIILFLTLSAHFKRKKYGRMSY